MSKHMCLLILISCRFVVLSFADPGAVISSPCSLSDADSLALELDSVRLEFLRLGFLAGGGDVLSIETFG